MFYTEQKCKTDLKSKSLIKCTAPVSIYCTEIKIKEWKKRKIQPRQMLSRINMYNLSSMTTAQR